MEDSGNTNLAESLARRFSDRVIDQNDYGCMKDTTFFDTDNLKAYNIATMQDYGGSNQELLWEYGNKLYLIKVRDLFSSSDQEGGRNCQEGGG